MRSLADGHHKPRSHVQSSRGGLEVKGIGNAVALCSQESYVRTPGFINLEIHKPQSCDILKGRVASSKKVLDRIGQCQGGEAQTLELTVAGGPPGSEREQGEGISGGDVLEPRDITPAEKLVLHGGQRKKKYGWTGLQTIPKPCVSTKKSQGCSLSTLQTLLWFAECPKDYGTIDVQDPWLKTTAEENSET
ncbi:Atp-Dependent Dna Helicase Q4 [Manis pentadactyla]|nr:Atp-Dependent Dna Helicase Q4 [Manis pentadactyla]